MEALRILLCTVLLIAALGFGGCLESQQKTILSGDGSGWVGTTVTLDVDARDDLLRRLAKVFGATEDLERLPFADPFHPRWVRALAEGVEGFTLEKVERTESDGKRTTVIGARFDYLRAAAAAGAFFSASVSLEQDPSGELWHLVVEDAWGEALTAEDGQLGGRPARDLVEALKGPLAGFSMERIFVLPTKVVKTNGSVDPDSRTVRWKTDLTSLRERKNLVLRITFEHAEGVELRKFKFEQDPAALVRRAFEPPPRMGR